jgi:hypothetical protein
MIKIPLSRLTNDQLYTLGNRLKELFKAIDAVVLGIVLYVTLFLEKFDIYSKSYEKQTATAKKVAEKDALRDNFFLALRSHLKNFRRHESAEKRKKALRLYQLLNKDGSLIYEESYSIQSASMVTTIKVIEAKYLADIELLNASEWYQFMKSAQEEFEKTISEVNEKASEDKLIESATKTRVQLESAMRKLFAFLPLHQEMTESSELDKLNRNIQTEGDRF